MNIAIPLMCFTPFYSMLSFLTLAAECDGEDAVHGHHFAVYSAHFPLGHVADYSHRLAVERLLDAFNHLHVNYAAVGVDNEAAYHATLNAVVIGVIGVFARLVDVVHQCAFATGELWLHIHKIVFINIHIGHVIVSRRVLDAHPAHLRRQRHRHQAHQCNHHNMFYWQAHYSFKAFSTANIYLYLCVNKVKSTFLKMINKV